MGCYSVTYQHRSPSGKGTRLHSANSRVRIPPGARLEGEVCEVQTPVPKIGWRASVRVRLLHLPRMEDDLAVVVFVVCFLVGFCLGLRFDSVAFRESGQRTKPRTPGDGMRGEIAVTGRR